MRLADVARLQIERIWWRPQASLGARVLAPLSWLYGAVSARRRARSQPVRLPVPVIAVGNWVVGGAGKTPVTRALVAQLQHWGWRPGIVARGYGRKGSALRAVTAQESATHVGDEPLLLARATGVPVWVGVDRVAAAQALLAAQPQVNLLIADDALQHHRLAADVNVIVADERGLGNGRLLPAGPLREHPPAVLPANTLLLFNAPVATVALPGHKLSRSLAGAWPLAQWANLMPADLAVQAPQAMAALQQLAAQSQSAPIVAAAGIAHPARFFGMLTEAGLNVNAIALPDHADWQRLPWPAGTSDAVVTEKDAVKLIDRIHAIDATRTIDMTRVWVVPLDLTLPPSALHALQRCLPPLQGQGHGPSSA